MTAAAPDALADLWSAIAAFSAGPSPVEVVLILSYWPVFLQGLINSVALVTLGFVFGAILGLPMAVARFQRTPVVSPLVRVFVYVFRGTPLLVQAYLFYYGLAQFEIVRASPFWVLLREPWWCVLVALSINSAAYQVEIYRGGLTAIPRGEIEAATAFGMSRRLALRRILIPAALRHCLPMLGNESIFLLHGSAIASMLTVVDVLGAGRKLNAQYYLAFEGFLAATAIYMTLVFAITRGLALLERKATRHVASALS